MKKICLMLAMVCFFSFNVIAADMTLMKSVYVGPFKLNKANWNTFLDANFLDSVSSLPEVKSFKVYGHTDNSGPEAFNQKLSMERAELVAEKLKNLYPDSEVNIFGKIYKPEDGQKVDYRVVQIEVYAEPIAVMADLRESLKNISVMIEKLKSKPEKRLKVTAQKVYLSHLESEMKSVSKAITDLKNSQLDLSQLSLNEKDTTLAVIEKTYNGLALSFKEIKNEQKEMYKHFQKVNEGLKVSINSTNEKVDGLVEKIDVLTESVGKTNPWNYILWLVPFLALLLIVLVLLFKKSKVQESIFECVEVNVTSNGVAKEHSVKCRKEDNAYSSPIRDFLYKNKKDLKQSIKSDLNNYYRNEGKSESFVKANLEEKIAELITRGVIEVRE